MKKHVKILMTALIIGGIQTVYADQSEEEKIIEKMINDDGFACQSYELQKIKQLIAIYVKEQMRHNKVMEEIERGKK